MKIALATCLDSVHDERERVQILDREVRIAACGDERAAGLNLLAHPGLILGVPRELVRKEGKRRAGRLVACERERVHLRHELCICESSLQVRRGVCFDFVPVWDEGRHRKRKEEIGSAQQGKRGKHMRDAH